MSQSAQEYEQKQAIFPGTLFVRLYFQPDATLALAGYLGDSASSNYFPLA
jgi:hypothetical protein